MEEKEGPKRRSAEFWLRDVSNWENENLPENLGNMPSDRDKESSQITKPRLKGLTSEELPAQEPMSADINATSGFRTHTTQRLRSSKR